MATPARPSTKSYSSTSSSSSTDSASSFGLSMDVQPVVSVVPMRCLRCHRHVEATSTDDITSMGMIRVGFNLYYCTKCADAGSLPRRLIAAQMESGKGREMRAYDLAASHPEHLGHVLLALASRDIAAGYASGPDYRTAAELTKCDDQRAPDIPINDRRQAFL
ncbi:hypothetical protein F5Y17DRAFT_455409 [Xylariaceae sp. FL0594]|nr:hypothetical protein F5Y17DRAFT_455409 [Xylariaceae sp. FL0594]